MNISYNWLKKYIAADLSAEAMATILTDIGLEVESFEKIETVRGGLQGVVVGEVLTCEKHPDSDHLHVTTVDVGAPEPLRIVCGAPNCRKGLKVLCATVGAVLYPEGGDEAFKIKRSKIRGVESLGMLCAEDELGIGASHDGIMELPADAPVGMPAKEYLHIEDDYLIGVGLTPNRVDAASHIGVARDLAAYLRAKGDAEARVLWPDVSAFAVDDHALEIGVTVENAEAAPRYTGVTITGCKIGPSPDWMQNALRAAGIHPKNNLVDITNYVLFELGQPLHAFDARKIEGRRIVVKTCAEGTPFVTLDGVERKLSDRDLMICSAERPMCIGGVFGGLESGVGDDTTDIFLESAYFNPVWVRKTAKRHGLNTDSSWRFERGVDPRLQVYALKRAALLFKELAGGRISSDIVEVSAGEPADFVFDFSPARSNALIGKELSEQTYRTILDALDVKILDERDGVWRVAVPPYRVDVQREADLVEEVLRIYGYNNVEIPVQVRSTLSYAAKPDRNRLMNLAADYLTAGGFTEIMSNSLTKESYYEGLTSYPAARCVRILNPLSADLNVMRQTLLFNTMEAVQLNANRRNGNLRLYEFGNCYFYDEAARDAEKPLSAYSEQYRLGDGCRRAAVVERQTAGVVVLHVARRGGEVAAPLRAGYLRPEMRAAAKRPLRRRHFAVGGQRQGAVANGCRGAADPPCVRPQTGGLLFGDEFRCAREIHAQAPHRFRGVVEIPGGEARPGAAGRPAGDLRAVARHCTGHGAQVAEKRLAVRCLRRRQVARRQEILCVEFRVGGQEPNVDRQGHRAGDEQLAGAVRTAGRCRRAVVPVGAKNRCGNSSSRTDFSYRSIRSGERKWVAFTAPPAWLSARALPARRASDRRAYAPVRRRLPPSR